MNWTSIVAFVESLAPVLKPMLLNLEANTIQPAIKTYLASENPNSDLVQLLTALDAGIDAFIQMEINKI